MKTIQYVFDCFFRAPSPYQIRRNAVLKGIFEIQYNGKVIHEGTYDECINFLDVKRLGLSPCLFS